MRHTVLQLEVGEEEGEEENAEEDNHCWLLVLLHTISIFKAALALRALCRDVARGDFGLFKRNATRRKAALKKKVPKKPMKWA